MKRWIACLAIVLLAAPAVAAAPPNVIIVLTDDQGYGDLSCHGNPVLKTPNLDRLHDQSIRLTDFHVAPMCTPSRAQLMTGCDAVRTAATFVCMGRSLPRAGLPMLADLFVASGYRTGHFGKWHLGDNYPYRPHDRAFEQSLHHPAWGITSAADFFDNDYFDSRFRRNDAVEAFKGYCTDVWFTEAMAWMKQCAERKQPFFTYLATNAPHTPHWVDDKFRQPYASLDHTTASFFGQVANLDENIGRLEEFLTASGLRDNTLLIFMTDNGTTAGNKVFNAGMRGRKGSLYEGGHRVPCFFRWPAGKLTGPRDIGELTHCQDIVPTLVELCGLKQPAKARWDGLSLAGLLRGQTRHLPDRSLIVQFGTPARNEGFGALVKSLATVMHKHWRLVNGKELYDLTTDPGQEHDIAAKHRDVVARLQADYEKWWAGVAEFVDRYEPIHIGSDKENPVRLTSCDWAGVYCDNAPAIRDPLMNSAPWELYVEREGTYTVTLRRWPEDSGLAIGDPAPELKCRDGSLPPGKAIPVRSAWISIGNVEQTKPVKPEDKAVSFSVKLDKGPTRLKTWWRDADEKPLAGAYYASVTRE